MHNANNPHTEAQCDAMQNKAKRNKKVSQKRKTSNMLMNVYPPNKWICQSEIMKINFHLKGEEKNYQITSQSSSSHHRISWLGHESVVKKQTCIGNEVRVIVALENQKPTEGESPYKSSVCSIHIDMVRSTYSLLAAHSLTHSARRRNIKNKIYFISHSKETSFSFKKN